MARMHARLRVQRKFAQSVQLGDCAVERYGAALWPWGLGGGSWPSTSTRTIESHLRHRTVRNTSGSAESVVKYAIAATVTSVAGAVAAGAALGSTHGCLAMAQPVLCAGGWGCDLLLLGCCCGKDC